MRIRRGVLYLADLDPRQGSEAGKIRLSAAVPACTSLRFPIHPRELL